MKTRKYNILIFILELVRKELFLGKEAISEEDYPKIKEYFNKPASKIREDIYNSAGILVGKSPIYGLKALLRDTLLTQNFFVPYFYLNSKDFVSVEELKKERERLGYREMKFGYYLLVLEHLGMGKAVRDGRNILGFKPDKEKIGKFYDVVKLLKEREELIGKNKLIYTSSQIKSRENGQRRK